MTLQSTSQNTKSGLLRRVLQANGVFSGISGIIFIVGAGLLASFLGLNAPLSLVMIGVILLIYAAWLFINAAREPLDQRVAWAAIISDVAWVVGSVVILLTGWPSLTIEGKWAVAIVADIVAVFAILQFYGLRRAQKK